VTILPTPQGSSGSPVFQDGHLIPWCWRRKKLL